MSREERCRHMFILLFGCVHNLSFIFKTEDIHGHMVVQRRLEKGCDIVHHAIVLVHALILAHEVIL